MTTCNELAHLELRLRRVFLAGLAVSATLLACGLVSYFVWPGAAVPTWLLNAGLVTLMATPLLRVLVSIAEYLRMRDWFFVTTTLVVLIELSVTVIYALRQR